MLILFNKTQPNKKYNVNKEIVSIINPFIETNTEQPQQSQQSTPRIVSQPIASFFAPEENIVNTCKYPINIRELFPYWLRLTRDGESLLISLTEHYYNWLSCNTQNITDLGFFSLEELISLENIPENLLEHLAYTYFNSLPKEAITQRTVSPEKVKQIIDNIKVNLYSKKGAEDSFKLLINEFFNIEPDRISISYPKKYLLRLNGGRFDWIRDSVNTGANYNVNIDDFYPQLTGSILNYSVIQDGDLWQDFSYVLNISGISQEPYRDIIKPIVHPAGTKDFFQLRQDIFNNVSDNDIIISNDEELPLFRNYSMYTIGSTATIGHTFGCTAGLGGVTAPIYVFPSWDVEISAKYYAGMSFGEIMIEDFLSLKPTNGVYPNSGLTCSNA